MLQWRFLELALLFALPFRIRRPANDFRLTTLIIALTPLYPSSIIQAIASLVRLKICLARLSPVLPATLDTCTEISFQREQNI